MESPLDIHVSPANERDEVNIASDSEVQNVVAFLSGNSSYDAGFEYQNKPNDETRREYGGHMTNYHEGRYGHVASGGDGREDDWFVPVSSNQQDSEKPPHERNNALGGQGENGSGGTEDGYVVMSRDMTVGSRSASISPRGEGEEREELRGGQPSHNSSKDVRGGRMEGDQRYHQHHSNLHSNLPKKKGGWDRREQSHSDNGRETSRDPQELSKVFSKGFGQLITSEPGMTGGMDLLHDSPDYQLSLRLLKDMNDDSDSERSG